MNYRNLLPLLATVLIISGCDQMQTALDGSNAAVTQPSNATAESTSTPKGKVLAIVNGTAITQDVLDVYSKSRKSVATGENANNPETILDELISLELVRQEGDKNGVATRPVIVAILDQQRRSVIASAAISDFAATNQTSDEEARKIYDEKMGSVGEEFNARHILLKTREEAVDVITALDGGADFSELAKEKSTGPSGKTGGTLGWFSPAQMVKPFSDAAAALEAGSYTKEPVETQFGWHVIILDDSREVTPPPFEDVMARLKSLITNQKLQAHIKEVRATADVKIIKE